MRPLWYRLMPDRSVAPMELGHEDPEFGLIWDISQRRVAESFIGPYRVSTVFLPLDHQFWEGPPLVFETMVFGGGEDDYLDHYMDRYSTWTQAEQGHEHICELVRMKVSNAERNTADR